MIRIKNKDLSLYETSLPPACAKHFSTCGKQLYGLKQCPRGFCSVVVMGDLFCHFFGFDDYQSEDFRQRYLFYSRKHKTERNCTVLNEEKKNQLLPLLNEGQYNDLLGMALHDIIHIIRDMGSVDDYLVADKKYDLVKEQSLLQIVKDLSRIIEEYRDLKKQFVEDYDLYNSPLYALERELSNNARISAIRFETINKILDVCADSILGKPGFSQKVAFPAPFSGFLNMILFRIKSFLLFASRDNRKREKAAYKLTNLFQLLASERLVAERKRIKMRIIRDFPDNANTNFIVDTHLLVLSYILIENALKHVKKEGDVIVEVSFSNGLLLFSVKNDCDNSLANVQNSNSCVSVEDESVGLGHKIACMIKDELGIPLKMNRNGNIYRASFEYPIVYQI